jgi:hypothetical protein
MSKIEKAKPGQSSQDFTALSKAQFLVLLISVLAQLSVILSMFLIMS